MNATTTAVATVSTILSAAGVNTSNASLAAVNFKRNRKRTDAEIVSLVQSLINEPVAVTLTGDELRESVADFIRWAINTNADHGPVAIAGALQFFPAGTVASRGRKGKVVSLNTAMGRLRAHIASNPNASAEDHLNWAKSELALKVSAAKQYIGTILDTKPGVLGLTAGRRGKTVSPNSNLSKARALLADNRELERPAQIALLVDRLGLAKPTATTYASKVMADLNKV